MVGPWEEPEGCGRLQLGTGVCMCVVVVVDVPAAVDLLLGSAYKERALLLELRMPVNHLCDRHFAP